MLAQSTLKANVLDLFSLLQLANACIHALGHVIVLGVLRLRHVQQLEGELADPVRGTTDNTSALALHTACASAVDSPFVEARDINGQRATVSLALVVAKADVGAGERSIWSDQVMQKVPGSRLVVALSGSLGLLLLLKCDAVSLFLGLAFLLLSLLGG